MMVKLIAIFVGGGLGSITRFYIGGKLNLSASGFPIGTLLANVLSSFILGVLVAYYLANPGWKDNYRLFLMTGFCGGFSTFSTYSNEIVQLFRLGQTNTAFLYLTISILAGLLAIFLGMKLYEWLF